MRFTDTIVFQKVTDPHYDADLGIDVTGETKEYKRFARVTYPTKQERQILFGDMATNKIIVHPKNPFLNTYDHAIFEGNKYFFVNQTIAGRRQIIYMQMRGDGRGTNIGNQ
ncbi:hypothetical protein [Enterococcus avium]|uniref:hypothetical protein n=1 Tax=Enterococcus avium TaxID=33945 RepID=UPI0032E4CEBA